MRFRNIYSLPLLLAGSVLFSQNSYAQVKTANFQVKIEITSSCEIKSATDMDFGSKGVLASNADATSTIVIQCTDTTPYTLGLNAGRGTGATVAKRLMSNGGATVGYSLYQTATRDTVWGDTVGTDTQSQTGNGNEQSFTVYGRVPPQKTPKAGAYTDTVTATIRY